MQMSFLVFHLTLTQLMVPMVPLAFILGINGFTFQAERNILSLCLKKYRGPSVLILRDTSP